MMLSLDTIDRKDRPDGDFTELSNVANRVTNLEEKVKALENKNTTWTVDSSPAKQTNERE